MRLPRDKRATKEQATSFVAAAIEHHPLTGHGDGPAQMMRWLSPRIGKD
jgi:hypothetical protein